MAIISGNSDIFAYDVSSVLKDRSIASLCHLEYPDWEILGIEWIQRDLIIVLNGENSSKIVKWNEEKEFEFLSLENNTITSCNTYIGSYSYYDGYSLYILEQGRRIHDHLRDK